METLKKLFSNIVFTSVLLLVLGGLLLFAPAETLQTYVRVIGVVLLVGAALGLLLEFVIKQGSRSVWAVVGVCVAAVCGLVFLLAPSFVTGILPFLFGVVLIVLSAFDLLSALQLPFGRLLSILLSAVGLVLGILIVSNPNALSTFITRLIGLALLYEAVVGFITAAFVKSAEKR